MVSTFTKFKNLKEEIIKRSNNIFEENINDKELKKNAINVVMIPMHSITGDASSKSM